jgi:hypothetical protein
MKNNTSLNRTEQRLLDFLTAAISTHRQQPGIPINDFVIQFRVDNCLPAQCKKLGLVNKVNGIGYVWLTDDPMVAFRAIRDLRKQEARKQEARKQEAIKQEAIKQEARKVKEQDQPKLTLFEQPAPATETPTVTQLQSLSQRIDNLETTLLDAVVALTDQVAKLTPGDSNPHD